MNKEQQDSSKLSSNFISELCRACLDASKIIDICIQHIKYHYLETDAQKKVFQFIFDSYKLSGVAPTTGVIAQAFSANKDVVTFLKEVKNTKLDKTDGENILLQLESFLKHAQFVEIFNTTHELYQKGERQNAIEYMSVSALKVNAFSLKHKYYTTVFKDYEQRDEKRIIESKINKHSRKKIPTGILELDEIIYGGLRRKTSALLLAQSGKGKSTALRWFGLSAARNGMIVVHFQVEGSEEECLEGYDAAWTATKLTSFDSQDFDEVSEKTRNSIKKARKDIITHREGEIIVYATESFSALTVEKSREILNDVVDQYGRVDLIIYDYLEVLETVEHYKDERKRREKIANNITNVAIEYDAASLTATQATDIDPKSLDNPDFVLRRTHISEFKGALKPFSYFLTINATSDEYDNDVARIYCDKFRRYVSGQTIKIAQKKDIGRFYEHTRTMNEGYYTSRM